MKLIKRYGNIIVFLLIIFIPRIIGWEYKENSVISFLMPLFLGIIFAENNLMVRISNLKINVKNKFLNILIKICEFIISTAIIAILVYVYLKLPGKTFYELRFGIIPVCLIIYLYKYFIDLPILKNILEFIGKYSMDVFLIHTFIRSIYLKEFIYTQGNFLKIVIILYGISLIISIVLELFKKLIRYQKLIDKIQLNIKNAINKKQKNVCENS